MKKYLFHGSANKIRGDKLLPQQAKDLHEKPENLYKAVYATDIKEIAIAMAIICNKGVIYSALDFKKKPFGIIYEGWPTQEEIYLYILPSETFKQEGGAGHQYYSTEPVKPINLEKMSIKDYMYLIRKATDFERENFLKKYGEKSLNASFELAQQTQ